jgi:hypothetical protein
VEYAQAEMAHKLNLTKPQPSGWLALDSSNETASIEKALNGDSVFIMPDGWRDAVQEAEMGDFSGVKVDEQRQKAR